MSEVVNTATIKVVADASGVEAGLRPAVDAARNAGKAVSQVGDGAGAASSKVEAASRNMIGAIQRTTAAMEAGGKTGAAYYEILGRQRGIDPSVLAPYIAQLRAVEEAQKAAGAGAEHFSLKTTAAKRELLVLMHELSQGNFKRFGSSLMVLGEQTGVAGALFSGAGLAALGLAAGVGTAAAAVAVGTIEVGKLNHELLATGDYAGVSTGEILGLSAAIGDITHRTGTATTILTELAASGRFTGTAFANTGTAAALMAKLTGESADDVVKQFLTMDDGVEKFAVGFDKKYHMIGTAVLEHISLLEKSQQKQEAEDLVAETIASAAKARLDTMRDHLSDGQKAWNDIGDAAIKAWEKMKRAGAVAIGAAPLEQELADRKAEKAGEVTFAGVTRRLVGAIPFIGSQMNGDNDAEIAKLEARIKKIREEQQKTADQAIINEKGNLAFTELEDEIHKYEKGAKEARELLRVKQQFLDLYAANPKSDLLKGVTVSDDGSGGKSVSGGAYDELLAKIHKRYTEKGTDDRSQVLQDQITKAQTALESEKSIYDARDKMLELYHTKFGLSDAEFYAGREAARAEYLAAEATAFAKESALLKGAEAQARNPQEVAAAREKYDQLVKVHQKFVDDMRNASGNDSANAEADIKKSYDDIAQAVIGAGVASIKALDDQIAKQREHNAEIGKTKAQIELEKQAIEDRHTAELQSDADYLRNGLTKWDLDEKSRATYQIRLNDLDAEIAKRREIAGLLGDASVLEANAKAADDAEKAWKHATNTIQNDLTSAIIDGGGKGWKKLVRDMEMAFAKMVLQPILEPVAGGLATVASPFMTSNGIGTPATSGLAGGATGLVGLANTASSLYGAVSGGMTLSGGLGTGFMGSIAGGLNGAGVGSGLTSSIGLSIGNSIADVVGPSVASSIATGMGAVATALPWIGAAVAVAAVGKAAFGMGPKQTTDQGINGTLTATSLTGQNYTDWMEKGGWFRSDKHGTDTTALSAQTVSQYTQALQAIETASSGFAKQLSVSADWVSTYSKDFNLKLTGDASKDAQTVTDFFNGISDEIAGKLVPSLADFSKTGETASTTLQRLAGDFQATDQIAQLLGKSAADLFGSIGIESTKAREQLINLAGGTATLGQEAQAYSQAFLTSAERLAPVTKAVDAAMASLGLSSIKTMGQFKAEIDDLVSSGRILTDAGAKEFASLMGLEGAFQQAYSSGKSADDILKERQGLQDQLDELTMSSTDLLAKQRAALDDSNRALFDQVQALQAQKDAIQSMKDSASALLGNVDNAFGTLQSVVTREKATEQASVDAHSAAVSKLQDLSQALHSTLDSLRTPEQLAYARVAAQAEIRADLAITKAGGSLSDAQVASLKKALSAVTQDASSQFSTRADYLRDLYQTQNDIAQLGSVTDDSLTVEQQALKVAQDQMKSLDDLLSNAQAQLDVLKGVDSNGLTLVQAMQGLTLAITNARSNPIVGATSAINGAYQQYLGRAPDAAGLEWWQNAAATGTSVSQIVDGIRGSTEASLDSLYQSVLGRAPDAAGLAFWMKAYGPTMDASETADWMKAAQQDPGYKALHPFAVGTNFVPETMPALVHQGERIIPAADNRALMERLASPSDNQALMARLASSAANNDALVAEVRRLRDQVEKLTELSERIEFNTADTADTLSKASAGGPIRVRMAG